MVATLDLGELNERDKLLMQRKISKHGLGLRSMEKNLEFLFLAGFMRSIKSIKRTLPNLSGALNYTIQGNQAMGVNLQMRFQQCTDYLARNYETCYETVLPMYC